MKILTFAGSLRRDSLNKKMCMNAKNFLQNDSAVDIQYIDLQTLHIPLYDGDLEADKGLPESVQKLCAEIEKVDALIISTPEYNGSISGVLKNTLDWLSRKKPNPLIGKQILLLAASPGLLGGIRGLWHSRVPFEALGCHVYPEMFGLGQAHQQLATGDYIGDEKLKSQFERILKEFVQYIK